jgi:hypothetical protein
MDKDDIPTQCLAKNIQQKLLSLSPQYHSPTLFWGEGGTKVQIQCFMFAKEGLQTLYHMSHTSSPFGFGCFGDGVLLTICSGWP